MEFIAQISSGEFHQVQWTDAGRLLLFRCKKECNEEAISIVLQSE